MPGLIDESDRFHFVTCSDIEFASQPFWYGVHSFSTAKSWMAITGTRKPLAPNFYYPSFLPTLDILLETRIANCKKLGTVIQSEFAKTPGTHSTTRSSSFIEKNRVFAFFG